MLLVYAHELYSTLLTLQPYKRLLILSLKLGYNSVPPKSDPHPILHCFLSSLLKLGFNSEPPKSDQHRLLP